MLKQPRRVVCHAPLARRQPAPLPDVAPDLVDERVGRVAAGRLVVALQLQLGLARPAAPGARHRHDIAARPPRRLDDLGRRAVVAEAEMPIRLAKRRVQDRIVDEGAGHSTPAFMALAAIVGERTGRVKPTAGSSILFQPPSLSLTHLLPPVIPAKAAVKKSGKTLDQHRASFETAASRSPQDEEFP